MLPLINSAFHRTELQLKCSPGRLEGRGMKWKAQVLLIYLFGCKKVVQLLQGSNNKRNKNPSLKYIEIKVLNRYVHVRHRYRCKLLHRCCLKTKASRIDHSGLMMSVICSLTMLKMFSSWFRLTFFLILMLFILKASTHMSTGNKKKVNFSLVSDYW